MSSKVKSGFLNGKIVVAVGESGEIVTRERLRKKDPRLISSWIENEEEG